MIHSKLFPISDLAETKLPQIKSARDILMPNQSSDWRRWRTELIHTGICGLDSRLSDSSPTSDLDVLSLSFLLGQISVDLRDVAGIGHARYLSIADPTKFREITNAVARNDAHTTFLSTETIAGSNLRLLKTHARIEGARVIVSGEKDFIARHRQATHFIVLAQFSDGLGTILIDANSTGVVLKDRKAMGLDGVSWGTVGLNDVVVPIDHVICRHPQAIDVFKKHFSFWRLNMAAVSIGAAVNALCQTDDYLRNRITPFGALSSFSHLQKDLGYHIARMLAAWSLVRFAATLVDREMIALACKSTAIEDSHLAVDWCINAVGARGYDVDEFRFAKTRQDIAGLRISSGPTDVLLCKLGRSYPFDQKD